jgi:hypothetical protein
MGHMREIQCEQEGNQLQSQKHGMMRDIASQHPEEDAQEGDKRIDIETTQCNRYKRMELGSHRDCMVALRNPIDIGHYQSIQYFECGIGNLNHKTNCT